jgi:hypothetical protein
MKTGDRVTFVGLSQIFDLISHEAPFFPFLCHKLQITGEHYMKDSTAFGFAPPPPRPADMGPSPSLTHSPPHDAHDAPAAHPPLPHLQPQPHDMLGEGGITPPSLYGGDSAAFRPASTAPPPLFAAATPSSLDATVKAWDEQVWASHGPSHAEAEDPHDDVQRPEEEDSVQVTGTWPMHSDGPTPAPCIAFDLSLAPGGFESHSGSGGGAPDADWDLSCMVLATSDIAPAAAATPPPATAGMLSVVDRVFWGKHRSESSITGAAITHSGDADVGAATGAQSGERLTIDLSRWSTTARQLLLKGGSKAAAQTSSGAPALVAVILAHPREMPPWHSGRPTHARARADDDDDDESDSDTQLQDDLDAVASSDVTWKVAVGVGRASANRFSPLASLTHPAPLPMPAAVNIAPHLQGPQRRGWRVYQEPAAWVVGVLVGTSRAADAAPSAASLYWTLSVPDSDARMRVASFHPAALLTPTGPTPHTVGRAPVVTNGVAPVLHPMLPAHLAAVLDATGALGHVGSGSQRPVRETDKARTAHLWALYGSVADWLGRRLERLDAFSSRNRPTGGRDSGHAPTSKGLSDTVARRGNDEHPTSSDHRTNRKPEPQLPCAPAAAGRRRPEVAEQPRQQQQQPASTSPLRAIGVVLLAFVIAIVMVVD